MTEALKTVNQIAREENEEITLPSTKRVLMYGWDGTQKVRLSTDDAGVVNVNATVTVPPVTVDTTGLATDTIQTNGTQKTQIVDAGGDAVTVTGGKLDVNASVTIPPVTIDTTGLATASKQLPDNHQVTANLSATDNAVLDAIAAKDFATETTLGTVHGHVDSIDTKTPALGQALAAASVPVVMTAAQLTTLTPPAAITNFANETGGNLAAIKAKTDNIPAKGQALAAASLPVVLTAAQMTTLTPPAAISGFATSAKQLADNHQVTVSNASLTVAGTVTANLGATDNAVLDAIAASTAAIETAVEGTLTVTGGGGGVQYTEGDTDASVTGTAIMWEDAANTLTPVSTAKPLPVSASIDTTGLALAANQQDDALTNTELRATPVPVSGSVTVDMGANNDVTVTSGTVVATQATGTNLHVVVDSAPTTAVTGTFYQATQPVSGTVTANLSATDNSVLDVIAAKDYATQTTLAAMNAKMVTGTDIGDVTINNAAGAAAVPIQDGGNSITVDGAFYQATQPVSLASVPSHAVTNAGTFAVQVTSAPTTAVTGTFWQATQPVSLASVPSHAVTNAGTFATQATLAAETTKVIGTVNIAASQTVALAAGTAGIGKLTANSGVDIGDVDVASIAAGTNAIGKVGHDITGIGHGVKVVTTAGTDVAIAASTACKRVTIQAQTDNTSLIAVGGSGVDATVATGTGVLLNPGDTFELEIDNLADVYIDALVNGEGARFSYFS